MRCRPGAQPLPHAKAHEDAAEESVQDLNQTGQDTATAGGCHADDARRKLQRLHGGRRRQIARVMLGPCGRAESLRAYEIFDFRLFAVVVWFSRPTTA
jgi:hypothetical protein